METLQVRNPRTGAFDYGIVVTDGPLVAAEARRLRDSQSAWATRSITERCAILLQWRELLQQQRDAIVAALAVDTGRHLIAAAEWSGAVGAIERWCAQAPTLLPTVHGRSQAQPSVTYDTQFVPYGLVGIISPWNFPLTLSLIDAIPALLAGCAVLIKPSEVAPRFARPLQASVQALPELAGVLGFVSGDGRTGADLIRQVDVLCFTGSVKTGRTVAQAAARQLIPAFLELGGKDPVIVTPSADMELATDVVLRASVLATGQACQSLERVYVPAALHDGFVARLVAKASAVTINYPDPHGGVLGPLIFDRQADVIAGQLQDAVERGARILCGGVVELQEGGRWMRPTVIVDVDHSMQLMREETFGPVMPVMRYQTLDEAVRLANDSEYGLSAAVIAGSLEEAESVARRIDAGAVSLNDGALTALVHEAEKNSFKCSGLGPSRMGASGFMRFLRRKALLRQTGPAAAIGLFDEANALRRST